MFGFVGRKIEWNDLHPNEIRFYNEYLAKYEILETVYGNYKNDTIEFIAASHYSILLPYFDYTLVVLSTDKDSINYKYLDYSLVYKTIDGRRARRGDPYTKEINKKRKWNRIGPEYIDFSPEISFNTKMLDSLTIAKRFPSPIYEIVNDTAICKMGCYVDDLFLVKKRGNLKRYFPLYERMSLKRKQKR